MTGYLIAGIAFSLPLVFGVSGVGRPRFVAGTGAVLAVVSAAALVAGRAEDGHGRKLVPIWFLAGLVVLLYVIWCGGLWLGLRLRRAQTD